MTLVALDLVVGSRSRAHDAGDRVSIALSLSGAVLLGYLGIKMTRVRCVASRTGLIVHNLVGPVRRINANNIGAIELRTMAGRFSRSHVPAVIRRNGREVKIRALAVGRSTDPPEPKQIAMLDEIRSILGLPMAERPDDNRTR
jgi:hypothetical protein